MANVLYRFYTKTGQLLYVGITMDPANRFKSHRGHKLWWSDVAGITLEHYETRTELANAERRAIQVEHPLHNVVRAKPRPQPITQPKPQPPLVEPSSPAALFSMSPQERHFDSRYGFVSESTYKKRVADARALQQGRSECTLCDEYGYRGTIVCDHIDRSNTASEVRQGIRNILRRAPRHTSGIEA